jgi:hypothetical protein
MCKCHFSDACYLKQCLYSVSAIAKMAVTAAGFSHGLCLPWFLGLWTTILSLLSGAQGAKASQHTLEFMLTKLWKYKPAFTISI